jgi:hypothetical protein
MADASQSRARRIQDGKEFVLHSDASFVFSIRRDRRHQNLYARQEFVPWLDQICALGGFLSRVLCRPEKVWIGTEIVCGHLCVQLYSPNLDTQLGKLKVHLKHNSKIQVDFKISGSGSRDTNGIRAHPCRLRPGNQQSSTFSASTTVIPVCDGIVSGIG